MKKLLVLILSVSLMVACLSGCNSSSKTEDTAETTDASNTTETVATETAPTEGEVSETLQKLREKDTIVIAGSGTAPFGFIDTETNEMKGIDLEISIAIANKLGISNVEYKQATFDNLISELESGKCDVVSSAMYIKEERQKKVDFSNVYYKEGEGILYKESSGYTCLEDMKGAVCAIEQGSGYANVAEQYKKDGILKDIAVCPSIDETVLSLKSNKADVAMADNVALAYINSKDENSGMVLLENYEMQYAGNIGAAFPKGERDFIEEWNKALTELKEDGTIMKIMEKYGLDENFFVEVGEDVTVNP